MKIVALIISCLVTGTWLGWFLCLYFTNKENKVLKAANAVLTASNVSLEKDAVWLRCRLSDVTEVAQSLSQLCKDKGWNLAGLHRDVAVIKNLPPEKQEGKFTSRWLGEDNAAK